MRFKPVWRRLGWLLPWLPPGYLRRNIARAVATRGDPRALRAEPHDPRVLVSLGLYKAAIRSPARGRVARAAQIAALAALGRRQELLDRIARMYHLLPAQRHEAARLLAPYDSAAALALCRDADTKVRAAIALAAGRCRLTQKLLENASDREALALQAALASRMDQWLVARRSLNAVFVADGLRPPLLEDERPLTLGAFGAAVHPSSCGDMVISVIIPVGSRGASTIAVRSILRQDWRPLEILIVDDGGADQLMQQLGADAGDPRIRLLRQTHGVGAAASRNTGIAAASGDMILFHDADDWAHPTRVRRQIERVGNRAAVVSHHLRLSPDGRLQAPLVVPFLRISPSCLLVRRMVLQQVGPFELNRVGTDSELLARLDARCGRRQIARDPSLLTIAAWTPGSLSGDLQSGLLSATGRSERLAYRDTWLRRHAGLLT
jgi:hypothetical protein